MGSKTIEAMWNQLEGLDLTPTEVLVLTALAHYASDPFGYCHPRQEQLAKKTKLGATAVKAALGSLKQKGFVRWSAKPKHPNEYILPFGGSSGADTCGNDGEGSPGLNECADVESAACTLLAQSFAALLVDRKRRFFASLDYTKPVKRLGFLEGFRLHFRIKAKLKGLTDDEIHARILKALADPESETDDET